MRQRPAALFALLLLLAASDLAAQRVVQRPEDPARRLGIALRKLWGHGRLLYVTAHPDDEDNGLLAYHGLGRGFDVTLLTLTRGEGGQNAIGDELFEALGVLRMLELEQAHRYDGAAQRFSRAFEFGYSFSDEETFAFWGEETILRDIVKVIRELKPQVVVTMPTTGRGGGRHHQSSAKLTARAFDVAATDLWPELGAPHAVDRLYEQVWTAVGRRALFEVPVHDYDPLIGCTWAELGYRARSNHKCQATGQVDGAGDPRRRSLWKLTRHRGEALAPGPDLFAGLEVDLASSAARREARPGLATLWSERETLNVHRPGPVLDRLLALAANGGADDPELARAIALASGVRIEAVAEAGEISPGDKVRVRVAIHHHGPRALELVSLEIEGQLEVIEGKLWTGPLAPNDRRRVTISVAPREGTKTWSAVTLLVQSDLFENPERAVGAFSYGNDTSDHLPQTDAARLRARVRLGGVVVNLPPVPFVHRALDERSITAHERDLALVPPGGVRFTPDHLVVPSDKSDRGTDLGAEAAVEVWLRRPGTARVEVFPLDGPWAQHVIFKQELQGPLRTRIPVPIHWLNVDSDMFRARLVLADGSELDEFPVEVDHPHVRRGYLMRPARLRVASFPLALPRDRRIGYVSGPGDVVFGLLRGQGLQIESLPEGKLAEADLDRFDVIVCGVRAYKTRDDLKAAHDRLDAWMKKGGHLIVQYNKSFEVNRGPAGKSRFPFAPWPGRVTRARATREDAAVTAAPSDHPFFTTPNPIGPEDWSGWVQERGLYFFEGQDERYVDLLTIAEEPGNPGPKTGALVTTKVGEGAWTYVGLSLFRQLPAGVPGAWRLMANLLAGPR